MQTFTFSQASQDFAALLNQAQADGKVLIKRREGSTFLIKPVIKKGSPLNVKGVDLSMSAEEIVEIIREIRDR